MRGERTMSAPEGERTGCFDLIRFHEYTPWSSAGQPDQTVLPSALATGEIRKLPEPALSGVLQISPSS
jgi:hypothetical protein